MLAVSSAELICSVEVMHLRYPVIFLQNRCSISLSERLAWVQRVVT